MASSYSFSTKFVLKSSEFRVAAFFRLGSPLPYSQIVTKCDCGTSLDENGYHLLINLQVWRWPSMATQYNRVNLG